MGKKCKTFFYFDQSDQNMWIVDDWQTIVDKIFKYHWNENFEKEIYIKFISS